MSFAIAAAIAAIIFFFDLVGVFHKFDRFFQPVRAATSPTSWIPINTSSESFTQLRIVYSEPRVEALETHVLSK